MPRTDQKIAKNTNHAHNFEEQNDETKLAISYQAQEKIPSQANRLQYIQMIKKNSL